MARRSLLEVARVARGLTQETVARRSGTSQPTLSAYERDARSPTLAVAERILHTLGFELGLQPRVTFHEIVINGRTLYVPDQLWRLDPSACFASPTIREVDGTRRTLPVLNREHRVEAYVWLLKHGDQEQLIDHLDGALLVDAWPDIAPHLVEELRTQWEPVVAQAAYGWMEDRLIAGVREPRRRPVSKMAQARAIKRMAKHGLTVDEIRVVLRRRSD